MGMFYGHNQSRLISLGYGLLYNWYAASDANFATSGWHIPSYTEWMTLRTFLGGWKVAGGKLKESGTTHWLTPNTGADNSSSFTDLAGGYRGEDGSFVWLLYYSFVWLSTSLSDSIVFGNNYASENNVGANMGSDISLKGFSVRLIKDSTSLSDGETSTMTDYDGNVYDTICIGTQEWIIQNWKCTHLNDGTSIPEVTDNTTWAGLSTGALCAYKNNWSYV